MAKVKNNKNLILKLIIICIVAILISSVWFIRNWIYLGNPVYPFLNNAFNGIEVGNFAVSEVGKINLSDILNPAGLIVVYAGFFGVPDGNLNKLNFFNIPYFNLLLVIWIITTIVFSIPFIIGLFSKFRNKKLLLIWIISYILLILLYIANAGWSVSRFMLPAFPAIAMLWANGICKIKIPARKILNLLMVIILMGFLFTSFFKIIYAAKLWGAYEDDFRWVGDNTGKKSIFMTASQCISYNINRQTTSPKIEEINKADYVFANQKFKLDNRAVIENSVFEEIRKNSALVYKNQETGTEIYKIEKK